AVEFLSTRMRIEEDLPVRAVEARAGPYAEDRRVLPGAVDVERLHPDLVEVLPDLGGHVGGGRAFAEGRKDGQPAQAGPLHSRLRRHQRIRRGEQRKLRARIDDGRVATRFQRIDGPERPGIRRGRRAASGGGGHEKADPPRSSHQAFPGCANLLVSWTAVAPSPAGAGAAAAVAKRASSARISSPNSRSMVRPSASCAPAMNGASACANSAAVW